MNIHTWHDYNPTKSSILPYQYLYLYLYKIQIIIYNIIPCHDLSV